MTFVGPVAARIVGREDRKRPPSTGPVAKPLQTGLAIRAGVDLRRAIFDTAVVSGPQIGYRRHGVLGRFRRAVLIGYPRVVMRGREVSRVVSIVRLLLGVNVVFRIDLGLGDGGGLEAGLVIGGIHRVSMVVVFISLLGSPVIVGGDVEVTVCRSLAVAWMTIGLGGRRRAEDMAERVVLADKTRKFGKRIRRGTGRAERRLVARALAS